MPSYQQSDACELKSQWNDMLTDQVRGKIVQYLQALWETEILVLLWWECCRTLWKCTLTTILKAEEGVFPMPSNFTLKWSHRITDTSAGFATVRIRNKQWPTLLCSLIPGTLWGFMETTILSWTTWLVLASKLEMKVNNSVSSPHHDDCDFLGGEPFSPGSLSTLWSSTS